MGRLASGHELDPEPASCIESVPHLGHLEVTVELGVPGDQCDAGAVTQFDRRRNAAGGGPVGAATH